jgi:acetate CoA/acetoacetate CoA-transferase beta subunit
MLEPREKIASRIAQLLNEGDLVNLGIGLPTLVANYIPEEKHILLHSENGFIGLGPKPDDGAEDADITNAAGKPVTIITGGACFDSAMSFAIIRGGHLNATVLGAFEVDEKGNLANWMVPGMMVSGMGGAMDLVSGAKKVIIGMEHTKKDGSPKILKQCTLPLTALHEVDFIVTELGVMEVTPQGIAVRELSEGVSMAQICAMTEADLITTALWPKV